MAIRVKILLILTLMVGLCTACGNSSSTPESVPDVTPEPTSTEEMVVEPESIAQDTFVLDELFSLGGGETAVLDTGDLQLHFAQVPEDSRCPTEVNCFWSGRALVVITAEQGGESVTLEFDTNPAPNETVDTLPAFEYMVHLEQLDPYPKNPDNPIAFTDYRVQLLVTLVIEEAMPSPTPEIEVSCTELGCDNYLRVGFTNTLPKNFMVEVSDDKDRKLVLHCFESNEGDNIPHSLEGYKLNSPDIEKITEFSSAPQMCEQNADGRAGITNIDDKTIVFVSCSDWPVRQFQKDFFASDCFIEEDYSGFQLAYPNEFLPEEITMVVHWETFSKTVDLLPEYEINQPNGLTCTPTCSEVFFAIELP